MVAFGSWTLLHWLVGLIAVLHVDAAATGSQNISSDAFFYGLSPAVYPTRKSCLYASRFLQPSMELLRSKTVCNWIETNAWLRT
jgi:hypothetical protein